MLTSIVAKYPNAYYILGHSGGSVRHEAEELAALSDHVILEFCGSFVSHRPFEETISRVKPEQIVFGSDTGAHDAAWELARFLSLPIKDSELESALGANMRGVLEARIS